jgi:hypothetical protein
VIDQKELSLTIFFVRRYISTAASAAAQQQPSPCFDVVVLAMQRFSYGNLPFPLLLDQREAVEPLVELPSIPGLKV